MDTTDDLIPITVVCHLVGGKEAPVVPATIYRAIKASGFPKPIKLGRLTSRWRRSEVIAFIEARAAERCKASL